MDGMITITKQAYINLRKADAKLSMLEAGGVDNWDWYGDSLNPHGEPSFNDICFEIEEEIRAA